LVVASLAVAAAAWSPFLLPPYADAEVDAGPPRGVRATKSTPTPTTPATSAPTPAPTKAEPTQEWKSDAVKKTMSQNRLYSAGRLPAVSCALPSGSLATKAAMIAFGQAIVGCLDKAWSPLLEKSSTYFESPRVYAFDDGGRTACGKADADESAGFYCSDNVGIYFDWRGYAEEGRSDHVETQVAMLDLIGHEYGHHLQQLSGILGIYNRTDFYGTSKSARLQASRRLELQASCFGAAFLGGNKQTFALRGQKLEILERYHGFGDRKSPGDHGSPTSNRTWNAVAFTTANPASCNTWSAPPSRVR
jgi:predicted metalloprotease